MAEDFSFEDLMRRVRAGDEAAAAELVSRYEPAVRRAAHFRLGQGRLRPLLESLDICQSVFASFFVRAAAGQFDVTAPSQLVRLLVTMAHNKLISHARKDQADCRDGRRVTARGSAVGQLISPDPGPAQRASTRELLREALQRLFPEERQLVELRNQGHSWNTIAGQLGAGAAVLRKRLSRALDRVTRELGLDGGCHE